MKCMGCIAEETNGVMVASKKMMVDIIQQAVDGAKTAITVIEGSAYCPDHLVEFYFNRKMGTM